MGPYQTLDCKRGLIGTVQCLQPQRRDSVMENRKNKLSSPVPAGSTPLGLRAGVGTAKGNPTCTATPTIDGLCDRFNTPGAVTLSWHGVYLRFERGDNDSTGEPILLVPYN